MIALSPHIAPALRLCVLVGWAFVIWLSFPAVQRTLTRKADIGDYKDFVIAFVGVVLIGFQLNAMKSLAPRSDLWTLIFLFLLAVGAGLDMVLVHLPRTPPGHKLAVVRTAFAIFAVCIVGGSLG